MANEGKLLEKIQDLKSVESHMYDHKIIKSYEYKVINLCKEINVYKDDQILVTSLSQAMKISSVAIGGNANDVKSDILDSRKQKWRGKLGERETVTIVSLATLDRKS